MKYLMTSVISGQRLLLIFCIHCYFAYIISISLYLCRVITFQRSDLVCDYHLVFWCIHVQILSSVKTNKMQYKLPSSAEELVYFYQILELFKHWALYFKSIQNYTCANFFDDTAQRHETAPIFAYGINMLSVCNSFFFLSSYLSRSAYIIVLFIDSIENCVVYIGAVSHNIMIHRFYLELKY